MPIYTYNIYIYVCVCSPKKLVQLKGPTYAF